MIASARQVRAFLSRTALLSLLALAVLPPAESSGQAAGGQPKRELMVEAEVDAAVPEDLAVSPDGRHVAFLLEGNQVVFDGKTGEPFERIAQPFCFPETGGRFAYSGFSQGAWYTVVDGRISGPFQSVSEMTFSPDGKRFGAILRSAAGVALVVIDGKDHPCGRDAKNLRFSPSGGRAAWIIADEKSETPVLDGKPWGPCFKCGEPVFSHDGSHVAVPVLAGGKHHWVLDGKDEPAHETLAPGTFVFSRDGSRFTYGVRDETGWYAVVDGKMHGPYRKLGATAPCFSPDGKRLAFAFERGDDRYVWVGGKELGPFSSLMAGTPWFGPDGKNFFLATTGERKAVVHWNGETRWEHPFAAAGTFRFNPEGDKLAYLVKDKEKWAVAVNGVVGAFHAGKDGPWWSPDGKVLACIARSEDKRACVCLQDKEQKWYRQVMPRSVTFLPDGKLAYIARKDEKWVLVIDGRESAGYDDAWCNERRGLGTVGKDKVVWFARQGKRIYRITETVG